MTGLVVQEVQLADSIETTKTSYLVDGAKVRAVSLSRRTRQGRIIATGRGAQEWNPGDPGYEDALARATAAIAADLSKS